MNLYHCISDISHGLFVHLFYLTFLWCFAPMDSLSLVLYWFLPNCINDITPMDSLSNYFYLTFLCCFAPMDSLSLFLYSSLPSLMITPMGSFYVSLFIFTISVALLLFCPFICIYCYLSFPLLRSYGQFVLVSLFIFASINCFCGLFVPFLYCKLRRIFKV